MADRCAELAELIKEARAAIAREREFNPDGRAFTSSVGNLGDLLYERKQLGCDIPPSDPQYEPPKTAPSPVTEEPKTETQAASQNQATPESIKQNQSQDDNSRTPDQAAQTNNPTSSTNSTAGTEKTDLNTQRAGTTTAGKQGVDVKTSSGSTGAGLPGIRTTNPLSKFASYTYQISLYMMTAEARDQFWLSEASKIPDGFYLVAQSGGINNNESDRASYFDLDVYIDDLKIKSEINYANAGAAINNTEFTFSITEPYGFSFPTRFYNAGTDVIQKSRLPGVKQVANISQMPFLIGVRFYGFGNNGQPITSDDLPSIPGTKETTTDINSVFERFYDVQITEMKFKIDGKSTKYFFKAVPYDIQNACNIKHGVLPNRGTVEGKTVLDVLKGPAGLKELLNRQQLDEVKAGIRSKGCENIYDFNFMPNDDGSLAKSLIVSPADLDKTKWSLSPVKETKESVAGNQNPKPNSDKQLFSIEKGTPIMRIINNIISQSSYVESALKALIGTTYDQDGETKEEIDKDNKTPVRWYNVIPQVAIRGFDPKIQDFYYKINYVIKPYDTPYARSAYAAVTSDYPGPHKVYNYWFTGKNSEVRSFELALNNLFFNIAWGQGLEGNKGLVDALVPVVPNMQQPYVSKEGRFDTGKEPQNSFVTSLYSPGDLTEAKLKIVGDPDYLIPAPQGLGDYVTTEGQTKRGVLSRFYGRDGATVNPTGGQVFVEIKFQQADDYNSATGTMNVNNKILFFGNKPETISPSIAGGISFVVKTVTSSFSGGQFVQDLDLILNTIPKSKTVAGLTEEQRQEQDNPTTQTDARTPQGASNSASSGGNSKTGDMSNAPEFSANSSPTSVNYDKANSGLPGQGIAGLSQGIQSTVPTSLGQVANDDNSPRGVTQRDIDEAQRIQDESGDPDAITAEQVASNRRVNDRLAQALGIPPGSSPPPEPDPYANG